MSRRYTTSLALSYFQHAAICYGQAYYVESIQHYLAGLKLDVTRQPHIYADLAKAYEMVGQWDRALAYLEIALRLCPDSPTVLRRKARILEEKACYDALICERDLQEPPSQDFLDRLQRESAETRGPVITEEFFTLTCDSAMHPQTVWNIYQLIHRTYAEVGEMLGCYPTEAVSISLINTNGSAASQHALPKWASGCYDGSIRVAYCADGEPVLSILYALIRHEWVHLLIHHLVQERCPAWLNEGLAQSIARPMFPSERLYLQQAARKGHLLSFLGLSKPFSHFPTKQRKLAYIQSAAIVEFLIQQFGFPLIRQLLHRLGNGIPAESAIEQTFKCSFIEILLAGVPSQ